MSERRYGLEITVWDEFGERIVSENSDPLTTKRGLETKGLLLLSRIVDRIYGLEEDDE